MAEVYNLMGMKTECHDAIKCAHSSEQDRSERMGLYAHVLVSRRRCIQNEWVNCCRDRRWLEMCDWICASMHWPAAWNGPTPTAQMCGSPMENSRLLKVWTNEENSFKLMNWQRTIRRRSTSRAKQRTCLQTYSLDLSPDSSRLAFSSRWTNSWTQRRFFDPQLWRIPRISSSTKCSSMPSSIRRSRPFVWKGKVETLWFTAFLRWRSLPLSVAFTSYLH